MSWKVRSTNETTEKDPEGLRSEESLVGRNPP